MRAALAFSLLLLACAEDPGKDAEGGKEFTGRRWNTAHFSMERKQQAREKNP